MPTIEERLARYAEQLDDAALAHEPASPAEVGGVRRGPGRRVLVAALGVAAALAIAVGIAVANHGGPRSSGIAPASTPTSAVATTPPTHPVSSSAAPTTATTSTTAATPPARTRVIEYRPFVGNAIDPRLHVAAQASGSCVDSSAGTGFRCFSSDGTIYDPCFAGPRGNAQPLVCPRDPSTADVVALTTTSPVRAPDHAPTRPWALQLEAGQVCLFASAAWGGLSPYSCRNSSAPPHVADCHEPASGQPWWSAACQEQLSASSPFRSQRVVAIWR